MLVALTGESELTSEPESTKSVVCTDAGFTGCEKLTMMELGSDVT
jgi:hypothetical protein